MSKLEIAIAEDSVEKLQILFTDVDSIVASRFDSGMNILNLAIDQESVEVVQFLADTLSP